MTPSSDIETTTRPYLMESNDESLRLELKTDETLIERQGRWAGILPGMRVADLGCGPGKTSAVLHTLNQPGGQTTGVDYSEERIRYAEKNYQRPGLDFLCRDIRQPLDDLGGFDLIWIRFVLEYHRRHAFDLIKNVSAVLKPGGTLCLIDLDNNCLNHYDMPPRLERTLQRIMAALQEKADFDPFAGRKLYSHLYNLGFEDVEVEVAGHHVIYGRLREEDAFNWLKKVEIAPRKINHRFEEYAGGHAEFVDEFRAFFSDPGRFTYSPVICCRGRKPL